MFGLAGLCTLALLSGDSELAVASLNELIKCGESNEAIKQKAVFNSYMSALGVSNHQKTTNECLNTPNFCLNLISGCSHPYLSPLPEKNWFY